VSGVSVTRWAADEPPSQRDIELRFHEESLAPSSWSNGPGDRYSAHSHPYHKVLYCAAGSIAFRIGPDGPDYELHPGDRLDILPGTTHSATVGPCGVTCLEASC
jgi:quercetin dioxygenase-like cupin family protein